MEEILERAKKITDQAEVFRVTSEETPVRFEANRLKQVQSNQTGNITLRVIKDGRIGYATADEGNTANLVGDALEQKAHLWKYWPSCSA